MHRAVPLKLITSTSFRSSSRRCSGVDLPHPPPPPPSSSHRPPSSIPFRSRPPAANNTASLVILSVQSATSAPCRSWHRIFDRSGRAADAPLLRTMSTSDNCISSSSGGKLAGEGGGGDADRAAVAAVIDVPDGHEVITEGQITMLYPKIENSVFYNPVQVQNRDLSVLMLGMYAERRTERMWTTRKRKEVRKKMMREEEE